MIFFSIILWYLFFVILTFGITLYCMFIYNDKTHYSTWPDGNSIEDVFNMSWAFPLAIVVAIYMIWEKIWRPWIRSTGVSVMDYIFRNVEKPKDKNV